MMEAINWYPGLTVEQCERELIERTLKFYEGNQTHAANSLGITVKTLYNKLKEYRMGEAENGRAGELPKGASETERESKNGVQVAAGSRMESNAKVSEKQSVPMRKRA